LSNLKVHHDIFNNGVYPPPLDSQIRFESFSRLPTDNLLSHFNVIASYCDYPACMYPRGN